MKKLLLIIVAVLVIPCSAMADDDNVTADLKLDMPYIVKLGDNWFVGAEGGKRNIFDSDASEEYFAAAKVTYVGTFFKFFQK